MAVRALAGAVGEAEVRAALLARLNDRDVAVRWAAMQALAAAVGEAEVRAALLARLADREGKFARRWYGRWSGRWARRRSVRRCWRA
ncbi:MAG: HEAT repeat domain-containing protein [Rhodospirillales bacterium]